MANVRIGIDARMCGPEQGGLGRYIQQLTKNIMDIFCQPREGGDPGHTDKWIPDQVGNDKTNIEFVVFLQKKNWNLIPDTAPVKKVLADIPWYGWAEQLLLPKIIRKEKVDLMHFPHWNIPLFYNQPFVATIHDLLLLNYPTRKASTLGPISYFFKNLAYRIVLRHAIKKSKKIITPSEFTKNDILKHFDIPAEKITTIHLAPMALPGSKVQSPKSEQNFLNKYNITKPYILYVGVAYPHKNLDGLIRAWKIFEEKYGDNYQLVLAGKKNYFYEQLERTVNCELGTEIIFTGFIPDEELPELYKNASLYVFPSFYEGFGLPPLEAMKYGLPVASSDRSCLPEILQNAAAYFNPEKPEEIAEIMHYILTDSNIRKQLISSGRQLLQKYSWSDTAKRTLKIYLDNV